MNLFRKLWRTITGPRRAVRLCRIRAERFHNQEVRKLQELEMAVLDMPTVTRADRFERRVILNRIYILRTQIIMGYRFTRRGSEGEKP